MKASTSNARPYKDAAAAARPDAFLKSYSAMANCDGEIATEHPTDISKMFARLVPEHLLVSDEVGRGMVYFLPGQDRSTHTHQQH